MQTHHFYWLSYIVQNACKYKNMMLISDWVIWIILKNKTISNSSLTLEEGDLISIDGSTGEIFVGEIEMESAELSDEFNTLMTWCDEYKKFSIRANAETVVDTSKSLEFGADGIGLCLIVNKEEQEH